MNPLLRTIIIGMTGLWGVTAGSFELWAGATLPQSVQGTSLPTLADIIEPVIPAVVNIATSTRTQVPEHPLLSDPFFGQFFKQQRPGGQEREQKSLGSGVVVDARKGIILTNQHVIGKADQITVTLRDGRSVQARMIGVDPATDIAVIQVQSKNLQDLPLGDSDSLRVGDFVVAIGNPFGLGQTVTSGIVSALGRKGLGIKGYEDFIQTDAPINPGNSGGALLNLRGELIGINTAILARGGGNVGIGFAIPVNMARQIMEQLLQYGDVRRGGLGIQAQDLTSELAEAFAVPVREGAVVAKVSSGSPAEKVGLRRGDVIVRVNSHAIRSRGDLHNAIGLVRTGEQVQLEFVRDGRQRSVTVTVAEPERQRVDGEQLDERLLGAVLEAVEGTDKNEGVRVLSVEEDSPAWQIKLRAEDRIISLQKRPVNSFREIKAIMQKVKNKLLIGIRRGNENLLILVR
ncbi:Do family serine endopeptidase [Candidatus Magnetaquicoccus inordinatus]|uniref:Do family serine endopeptidase n=1 Tax=Candidatus Magnetaquicoccus inordinatus TaxID=2496818 RepID=UPI00102ADA47|nr:Do family serine endopeptidase [Candidatus Magnetaquicoccus inordinatus]